MAKGDRWSDDPDVKVREMRNAETILGVHRPLASCLRSKDSRAVWRGAVGKGPQGTSLAAYPTASPVLNGEDEETGRKALRLVLTQHHHTGKVLAYVFGRRQDTVFLQLKALREPFGITQ